MSVSTATSSEREAIARTIECYVDGGKSGDSARMREAFHPDATIFGYAGDELFAGPIEKLFAWVDQNGPAPDLKSEITNVDVAETIATVRLELNNWSGRRFTDMFTLLKVLETGAQASSSASNESETNEQPGRLRSTQWKIISKVFYLHA